MPAGGAALAMPHLARAQAYPSRAIRIIVPRAAGAADSAVRPRPAGLASALGQSIVIESGTWGGGAIGANRVRTARPTAIRCPSPAPAR